MKKYRCWIEELGYDEIFEGENEAVADARAYCHFCQFYLFVDHAKYSMEIEEIK